MTIDCTGAPPPPPPSALVIAPNNFNYSQTTCVNQTANFVVTGGTPPYSVFFASPRPGRVDLAVHLCPPPARASR